MAFDFGTRRYKLAGVKQSLFHPRLPTFRRIDMDTTAHKLPDEHCRSTTPCSRENFINNSVTIGLRTYRPFNQTGVDRKWYYRNYYSFQVDDEKEDEGTEENAMPDEANVEKPASAKDENLSSPLQLLGVDNRQWRFSLQQEPYIDHYGQRPIPATIFSRYRSTSSLTGGHVSTKAWRP